MPEMEQQNVETTEALAEKAALERVKGRVNSLLLMKQYPTDEERNLWLQEDLQELLLAHSFGANPAELQLHRYIPAEIYVPGEVKAIEEPFAMAVHQLLLFSYPASLEVHAAGPVEVSSLRQKWIFRTDRLTLAELGEDLATIRDLAGKDDAGRKRTEEEFDSEIVRREKMIVDLELSEAKLRTEGTHEELLTAQIQKTSQETKLARSRHRALWAGAVVGLLGFLLGQAPPGTQIQIGDVKITVGGNQQIGVEQKSAGEALQPFFPVKFERYK